MSISVNYNSKCCGLKEIDGLAHIVKTEDAMLEFCKVIYPTEHENEKHLALARQIAAGNHVTIGPNGPVNHGDGFYWGGYAHNGAFESPVQYSRFRFATFSEAIPPPLETREQNSAYAYGRRFAAFITKHGLGTVVESPREINPNSGNHLQVWVWCINHDTLKAWYDKVKPPTTEKVKTKVSSFAEQYWGNPGPAPTMTQVDVAPDPFRPVGGF